MALMKSTFRNWRGRKWWTWRAMANREARAEGDTAVPVLVFSASSIPEDTAIGAVVAALSVSNLGALTVTGYAITADPDSKFAVDGANLELDDTVDYETANTHSVTVTATLSDASTVEGTKVFSVTDVVEAFDPLTLTPVVWYDPSDLSTLWQDSARTTPVTTDGDVVGCIDDKSGNGHHLKQATTAAKPLYKTAGGLHWLLFDGVDDILSTAASVDWTDPSGHHSAASSLRMTALGSARPPLQGSGATTQFVRVNNAVPQVISRNAAEGAVNDGSGGTIVADQDFVHSELTASNAVECFQNGVGNGPTASTGHSTTNAILNMGAASACRIYQSVIIGRAWTAGEKTDLEAYVASKAGVSL